MAELLEATMVALDTPVLTMHLAAWGQRQRLKRDILMGPFADDAVFLQGDQKAQSLFPEELEVLHPGVPAARRSPPPGLSPQPSTSSTISRKSSLLVLPSA